VTGRVALVTSHTCRSALGWRRNATKLGTTLQSITSAMGGFFSAHVQPLLSISMREVGSISPLDSRRRNCCTARNCSSTLSEYMPLTISGNLASYASNQCLYLQIEYSTMTYAITLRRMLIILYKGLFHSSRL